MQGSELKELYHLHDENKELSWITTEHLDGVRIYQRGLLFVFYLAVKDLFPEDSFRVRHSLSHGLYIEFKRGELSKHECEAIEEKMKEIVDGAHPFTKVETDIPTAKKIYEKEGLFFKNDIIGYKKQPKVTMYECMGYHHYFYGYMVPDTSYLPVFGVRSYSPGIILRHPNMSHPDELGPFVEHAKIHLVHQEAVKWGQLIGVSEVSHLNAMVENGDIKELIHLVEALQEKNISAIADDIHRQQKRVVFIAGPSSSGKTTFSKRLMIQLRVLGLKPKVIGLDDFFVNREDTPLDDLGNYDYDSLEAIDLALFNRQIQDLMDGEEVILPRYDFIEGRRKFQEEPVRLHQHEMLIIEGIHALNDKLSESIDQKDKYKIYISALTQLNLDHHNRIPTTDNRLIRRLVRDHATRGSSAEATLKQWASVRRGEDRYIFPFQERADAVFNSALSYELAILRDYALELLDEIKPSSEVYAQAKRLKKFLYYFRSFNDRRLIPTTSLLREFIGGSALSD